MGRARACLATLYLLQRLQRQSSAVRPVGAPRGDGGGGADSGLVDSDSTLSIHPAASSDKDTVAIGGVKGGIVGARLGRFEIVREIGQGGYGVVFLARDPVLGRHVALKVPRPDVLLTPETKRRFLREGKAAALLNHPNLLTVLDAGETGPICWLVQAYCPGESLATWIRRFKGPKEPGLAARIVADLADGVEHAHARGVLHRDIKPSNVMLEPSTGRDEVGGVPDQSKTRADADALPFTPKLTDFGLAKLVEADADQTATGLAIGTPAYMPPEQAAGHGSRIGPASDVYGLGAILYELLTGQAVFRGDSHIDTLRRVMQEEPASPRRIVPKLSRDLEAICLKCLEKDPKRRYASAQGLAEDLRRYLRGEPTRARPLARHERVMKWARREPMAAALVVVSTLAVVVVLGLSLWGNARLAHLLREADKSRQETESYAARLFERTYAADMGLASQAWDNGHVARGRELLARYEPKSGERDPRGFEWWYLWRLFHQGSQVIAEHPGGANAVASAPAGRVIATGGSDGYVKLLSSTGQLLHQYVDPEPVKVNHVALTPDGAILAAAYENGNVRMWRTAGWEEIRGPMRHEGWVAVVAFHPNGKSLASGGEDRLVRLWSTTDGSLAGTLEGHTDTVRALVFHPEQGLLVSAAEDGTVRVWDSETGQPNAKLTNGALPNRTGSWIRTLAFEQTGEALAGGTPMGDLLLWNFRGGHLGELLRNHKESAEPRRVAALSECRLAIGRSDAQIRTTWFGINVEAPGTFLRGHVDRIEDLAAGILPSELLSAARDGTVRLWKLDPSIGDISLPSHLGVMPRMVWRGSWLTVASGNSGPILVMSMPEGKTVQEIPATEVLGLDVDPAADQLLYADIEGHVRSVEVSTGKTRFEATLGEKLGHVALAPSGRLAAVKRGEHTVVLDSQTGAIRWELPSHGAYYVPAVWLGRQDRLAIGGADGRLRIWDAESGQLVFEHQVHPGRIAALSASSDANVLATSAIDRTIKVWSTRDWRLQASIPMEDESYAFSLMGNTNRLAVWEGSTKLRIVDIESGERVLDLTQGGVRHGQCVSPDGSVIIHLITGRLYALDGRPVKDSR